MARPPFTFARNALGSNGSFALRFIVGPPYREGKERCANRTVRSGSSTSRSSRIVSTESSESTSHTAGSCAASDDGAYPRQWNTILLERPLPSLYLRAVILNQFRRYCR